MQSPQSESTPRRLTLIPWKCPGVPLYPGLSHCYCSYIQYKVYDTSLVPPPRAFNCVFCDATRQAATVEQIQIGGFEQILMILSQWCEKVTTKDMHHLALDPGST